MLLYHISILLRTISHCITTLIPALLSLSLHHLSLIHTHSFSRSSSLTNYPHLCIYLQNTSNLLHNRLNSKPITHRLDTSLENRPGYPVIMSPVIILIAGMTILTALSHIHFSPLPSLHPPITPGHHTKYPLVHTHTYRHTYYNGTTLQSLHSIAEPRLFIHAVSILATSLLHDHIRSISLFFTPCHPTLPPIKIYRRCPATPLEHFLQILSY